MANRALIILHTRLAPSKWTAPPPYHFPIVTIHGNDLMVDIDGCMSVYPQKLYQTADFTVCVLFQECCYFVTITERMHPATSVRMVVMVETLKDTREKILQIMAEKKYRHAKILYIDDVFEKPMNMTVTDPFHI
ncbi:unnamed protein product [Darwinula stevensoni]|uniref:Uncharacterized protein n=1 Tax=Darwinula stevensoni TaxID=69355 RepID=A0A7R9FSM2_9CRUS|nr:unnamed protein product [Darwinula stevensoni]CAG0904058.1 unnamed protein product [Darwinula stevensoni]